MTTHPDVEEFLDPHGSITHIFANGGGQENLPNSEHYRSFYKVRGGGNSPSWPSIKTTNNYIHAYFRQRKELLSIDFTRPANGEAYIGTQPHPIINMPFDSSEGSLWPSRSLFFEQNRTKIVNKLFDNMLNQKVNLAQMVAERQQTANLVASTAKKLAASVLALRRGNLKHAITSLTGSTKFGRGIGRSVGGIPEQWLALQYGWKPLLSDVYGSCEELAKRTQAVERPPLFTVSASAVTHMDEFLYETGGDGSWIPSSRWRSAPTAVHGKGSVTMSVTSEFAASLASTGISNPLLLAWEVLPWSFVVDWFLPVGNFLQRLGADAGLFFQRGYISQKLSMSWSAKLDHNFYPFNPFSGWQGFVNGGNHVAESFTFQREALSGLGMPSYPAFKDPFTPTHAANALALLATAFGRGKVVR